MARMVALHRGADNKMEDAVCDKEGVLFQHPSSGVVHFSADYTDPHYPLGVECFSA